MSVFRDALVFFDTVGLYDVVLPFLLIFTLVYGVLEKSRIFGTEKAVDGKEYTRKNLNSMVAFVTGFFVVASAQLVSLINVFVARVALILVILIMYMILVASFHEQQGDKGFSLKDFGGKWLMWLVFIAVILIFLDGLGWLGPAWLYVTGQWDSQLMGTILLFAIVVGFIWFITSAPGGEEKK